MSNLAPYFRQQFFDSNGLPLAGGLLYTYQAGTTTPQATYTDSTLGTPNTNPVVLDSSGTANIWLGAGLSYKFVLQTSAAVAVETVDNIVNPSPATPYAIAIGGTGVSSVTTSPTANAWAGWDVNKNFSANNVLESATATATAAGTTTLTVASAYQQVFTGSTTQTVVMPVVSTLVLGASYQIINNSTGLVTVQSSGANSIIVLTAGTYAFLTCVSTSGTGASSWYAQSPGPRSEVWLYGDNGYGSSSTAIKKYSNIGLNTGTAISYNSGTIATLGTVMTINEAGVYSISIGADSSGQAIFGISKNSSQLTTTIASITPSTILAASWTALAANIYSTSVCTSLAVGDVIRAHGDSNAGNTEAAINYFRITKVSN